MTNKEIYIQLVAQEAYASNIPVFALPYWLDAVAENWNVCVVSESEREIIAVLPYCWKGNFITKRIYLPDLNFYQSVIFFKAVKNKQEITQKLIQQLPKTVKTYLKFLPTYSPLDLSNLNYTKEEYYTYIIPKQQQILSLSNNHKRNIQKGIKQQYSIQTSKNIELSFALLVATFARQKQNAKVTLTEFKKINALVKKQQSGQTLDCFDKDKNLLASVFIIEDAQTVYYLLGGFDTHYKNSGAMTFLLHYCIQYALQQQKDFNFCGSTKKSIATFFEGFGATKTNISIWKKSILS